MSALTFIRNAEAYILNSYVHGDGSNSRRYLYVSDVVEALITVLHEGQIGQIYNIGTDFEISNFQLAKYLIDKLGLEDKANQLVEFVQDRAFNDLRYAIDSSKLLALGWKPRVSFEEGISKTSKSFVLLCTTFRNMNSIALQSNGTKKT